MKETTDVFEKCSMCGHVWDRREEFISDPEIKTVGYMVNFDELELGLFLFHHAQESCGTSLAIHAAEFTDMYTGPVFEEKLTGTKDCPEYCLYKSEIRPCPANCECAYVREVLNMVANRNLS